MIERIIEWSLRSRFLVVSGVLLLVALGIHAVRTTPVDAIPDLSEIRSSFHSNASRCHPPPL